MSAGTLAETTVVTGGISSEKYVYFTTIYGQQYVHFFTKPCKVSYCGYMVVLGGYGSVLVLSVNI